MERERLCLHEANELCYNFINIVTWERRHQCSYLGANFLIGSYYPRFLQETGPLVTLRRERNEGARWGAGSRGGQRELCGPAGEPRNPPELSSSAGQGRLVDPGSAEPFRCYACKAATMYSSLAVQPLKFYECKAWRTEVWNQLRSQLYDRRRIHGLAQAVELPLMRRGPKAQTAHQRLLYDFSFLCLHGFFLSFRAP